MQFYQLDEIPFPWSQGQVSQNKSDEAGLS